MFETLGFRELYQDASYTVTVDKVALVGEKQEELLQIHHPGAVAVLAIDDEGRIPLVRQYRYAVKQDLLEIPAGKLDKIPGETPEEGAIRELREETGVVASHLVPLGVIYPSPGILTEVLHLYFAEAVGTMDRQLDEDEFIDVVYTTPKGMQEEIQRGSICDAKTVCAWTRALLSGFISLS